MVLFFTASTCCCIHQMSQATPACRVSQTSWFDLKDIWCLFMSLFIFRKTGVLWWNPSARHHVPSWCHRRAVPVTAESRDRVSAHVVFSVSVKSIHCLLTSSTASIMAPVPPGIRFLASFNRDQWSVLSLAPLLFFHHPSFYCVFIPVYVCASLIMFCFWGVFFCFFGYCFLYSESRLGVCPCSKVS